MRRLITMVLVCVLASGATPVVRADSGVACPMALATAAGQYAKRRLIVSARCRLNRGHACAQSWIEKRMARYEAKLAEKLAAVCSDAELMAVAPDGLCPDPRGPCALPVDGVESALACIACLASGGVDALDRVMAFGAHGDRVGDLCGGCGGAECGPYAFCERQAGACDDPFAAGSCVAWDPKAPCTEEFAPVCGCDGLTYPNDCERLRARTSKAHDGSCEQLPGPCSAGSVCPNGQFCDTEPGHCQKTPADGKCVAPPQVCAKIYAPVCGCDGNTYANDCERLAAAVTKDHDGECTGSAHCGGPDNAACEEGRFCERLPGMCHVDDRPGRCNEIPEQCDASADAPVCGCDGLSYASDCLRRKAGVSMAYLGNCQQVCGGIAGIGCPEGETCMLAPGSCQVSDAQGVCVPIPLGCPDYFKPVCGCDGKTYGNPCDLLQAGVALDHYGPCGDDARHDGERH